VGSQGAADAGPDAWTWQAERGREMSEHNAAVPVDWNTCMKCITPDGPGVVWQRFQTTCEVDVEGQGLGIYAFETLTEAEYQAEGPGSTTPTNTDHAQNS